jgi:TolB-like protein
MILALLSAVLVGLAPLPPRPQPAPVAPRAVAVLDFVNNSGDPRYDPLGKGIAAMMISDLSAVDAVRLVERAQLQELIRELDLQRSDHFDPATAQKVGRMIGAEYVMLGSIVVLQPQLRIDTRVVEVSTGEIVKTAQVEGREARLFDLQQKLADQLIRDLDIALVPEERERLRARQEANRIDELETTLRFSEALVLFDREDYLGASERMFHVVRAAPNSLLVRLTYDEGRRKATETTRARAREGIRRLLRPL